MALQLPLLQFSHGSAPSFKRTAAAMGDLPTFFYAALESGSAQMRTYFETLSNGDVPRPHVREMLVRDQVKLYLGSHHFQIEDEKLSVGNEPLAAVLIRCGPLQVRILKGPGGTIPGCHESEGRRRFYNQKRDSYLDPLTNRIRTTKLNLVLLWDFDAAFNIPQLWLACPLRAGDTSANVLTQWLEPLPHPATVAPALPSSIPAQQQADADLESLLRDDEARVDEKTGSDDEV